MRSTLSKRGAIALIIFSLLMFAAIPIIVAGLIGYNPVETSKDINMHSQYDEIRDAKITLDAPDDIRIGSEYEFSGRLTDKTTGEGVPDKIIFVRFEGALDLSCEYITDANGYFGGRKIAPVDCKTVEKLVARYAGG